jgi:hypothetical protein
MDLQHYLHWLHLETTHLIAKQCLRCRFFPLDLTLADLAREVVHNEGLFVDVVGLLDVFPPLDEPLV